MDKFVLISILLSVGWHSLAFVLFKLTEPYHSKVEMPAVFEVKLVQSPVDAENQFMRVQNNELLNRFSLPERVDPLLPVDEYALELVRRSISLKAPEMSSDLIEHKPRIIETPAIHHVGYDIVPDTIQKTDRSSPETVALTGDPVRHVEYRFTEKPGNRSVEESFLPDNINGRGSIVLHFSIDSFGAVRFVFVERSTGDAELDKKLINLFKKWRFSKAGIPKIASEKHSEEWGRIIFFVKESF